MDGTQLSPQTDEHYLDLRGKDLKEIRFEASSGTSNPPSLRKVDFTGANLQNAKLKKVVLEEVNLSDADLAGADLTGANLTGAILQNAKLKRVILGQKDENNPKTNLTGADLTGATSLTVIGLRDKAILNTKTILPNGSPYSPLDIPLFDESSDDAD